jgi:hypothetical protein
MEATEEAEVALGYIVRELLVEVEREEQQRAVAEREQGVAAHRLLT